MDTHLVFKKVRFWKNDIVLNSTECMSPIQISFIPNIMIYFGNKKPKYFSNHF